MECKEKMTNNENLMRHDKVKISLRFFLSIGLVWIMAGSIAVVYGQGSLVETVGTMEISQQIDNAADRSTPKKAADLAKPANDANNTAQPPNRNPNQMQGRPNPPAPPPDSQPQPSAVVETPVAAPAMTAETNVPEVNDFNAFKRELDHIDMSARGEDSQWLGKQEKKEELARAMNNVVVAELGFLRKVAAAANDVNTVEAIDLVLKKRQDRLNKLVTKLDNETKEERQPRERRQPRTTGAQKGQPQGEHSARSTNPVQRTKDTVNQEQSQQ